MHGGAGSFEAGIPANDQVGTAWQRAAQRLPGVAAHYDGVAQRSPFKVRQVGGQMPWQSVVAADDAVVGVGDNNFNIRTSHGWSMEECAGQDACNICPVCDF